MAEGSQALSQQERQRQRAGGTPSRVTEPRGALGSEQGWSQCPGRAPGWNADPDGLWQQQWPWEAEGAAGATLGPELGGRLSCSSAGPISVASTPSLPRGLTSRRGQASARAVSCQ